MCFSEEASFIAAGVLTTAAAGCFSKVKGDKSLYPLAAIPLFFAMQQFSEGVQWLWVKNIAGTLTLDTLARQLFLFIATVLWPVWIPFSFLCAEKVPERKKILLGLLALGSLVALYDAYKLFFFPTHTEIVYRSIQYHIDLPLSEVWIYGVAVLSPWFVSSLPRARIVGGIFTAAAFITGYVYFGVFISLWCFFSALVSSGLFYMLSAQKSEALKLG